MKKKIKLTAAAKRKVTFIFEQRKSGENENFFEEDAEKLLEFLKDYLSWRTFKTLCGKLKNYAPEAFR